MCESRTAASASQAQRIGVLKTNMGKAPLYYVLIGKLAVPSDDPKAWARMFEGTARIVAKTRIGGCEISTVFLGLDHNFGSGGLPILFETMVFRGGSGEECERCETWEQAEAQHAEMVAKVRAEIKSRVNE